MREAYLNTYFIAESRPEGLPDRFGVITAFNPNGALAPQGENLDADRRLKQRLEELSCRHFRVTGTSRDGGHQEPGFGVVTDHRGLLESLCREFCQEAYFWIEKGVIHCTEMVTGETRHLGSWWERQLTI